MGISRRALLLGGGLAALGAAGTGAYAVAVEPYQIEYTDHVLDVAGLPLAWANRTIAHLSDVHVGPDVPDAYVKAVFAQVAAFEPDVVAVTGDLSSAEPGIADHARRVYAAVPRGRVATLAVLGNHDYSDTWRDAAHADRIVSAIAPHGVQFLRNQSVTIEGLTFYGTEDLWSGRLKLPVATRGLRAGTPAIGLVHNPDALDLRTWGPVTGWVLSGHTHGGQVVVPGVGAPRLPVVNPRYASGVVVGPDGRRCYISRGIGHASIRVRFNCRPEVTLHRLVRAS